MREGSGAAMPDHRIDGRREGAIRRLGDSRHLPALQRLALVEELAADVEGLAVRLEAGGLPPLEARRRALELLAPSPEAVDELEQLHGLRQSREWWPAGVLALAGGCAVLWGVPPGPGMVTLPVAVAGAVLGAGTLRLVRLGWSGLGEDAPEWHRSLRVHLAGLVVLWSATLLGVAVALHHWLEARGADAVAPLGPEAAGGLATLLHPALGLLTLGTAVTLAAVVHLTLLVPRVAGRLQARDAVEEILQILLQGSR